MVSTFWKMEWLKLVIRVKLIKYQYPLKRVSWANILLVWNIQQNKVCQSLDDASSYLLSEIQGSLQKLNLETWKKKLKDIWWAVNDNLHGYEIETFKIMNKIYPLIRSCMN